MSALSIRTNTTSSSVQVQLQRNIRAYADDLLRLSTGSKINTPKDDPSGYIASQLLRSEISASNAALKNTESGNYLINTASAAMSQISNQLIDEIQSAIVSYGSATDDEKVLLQLKIDSAIDAIDRLTKMTTFQGKRLLDGSQEFTTAGTTTKLKTLNIHSYNSGSDAPLEVNMKVQQLGESAKLTSETYGFGPGNYTISGSRGFTTLSLGEYTSVTDLAAMINAQSDSTGVKASTDVKNTAGRVVVSSAGGGLDGMFAITGDLNKAFKVVLEEDTSSDISVALDSNNETITITLGNGATHTAQEIVTELMATTAFTNANFSASILGTSGNKDVLPVAEVGYLEGLDDGTRLQFLGGADSYTVKFTNTGLMDQALELDLNDAEKTLYVNLATDNQGRITSTVNDLLDLFNKQTAAATGGISLSVVLPTGIEPGSAAASQFGYALLRTDEVTLEADSLKSFGQGEDVGSKLILESNEAGSNRKVAVSIVGAEHDPVFVNDSGSPAAYAWGTDARALLNGQKMQSVGNTLSINSPSIALETTLDESVKVGDTVNFWITGGGLNLQLGSNVTSRQQYRFSIGDTSSLSLGGSSGKLYELKSGGSADLETNLNLAERIVHEAISSLSFAQGRLGTVQKSVMEPNQFLLEDTIVELEKTESLYSDVDMAELNSRMARTEILIQSASQALSLATYLPQWALKLLD